MSEATATSSPASRERILRGALIAAGAGHLVLGLMMALSPGTFFESIAAYETFNAHYTRDVSTFYIALGVALLVAAARADWRVPLLAFTVLQYVLHVVNHGVDVGDTDPSWQGPANLASLAATGVLLALVLRGAARRRA